MRAALNRDIEKAVEFNRAHINRTLEKVAASLATEPALSRPNKKAQPS